MIWSLWCQLAWSPGGGHHPGVIARPFRPGDSPGKRLPYQLLLQILHHRWLHLLASLSFITPKTIVTRRYLQLVLWTLKVHLLHNICKTILQGFTKKDGLELSNSHNIKNWFFFCDIFICAKEIELFFQQL